tara:strand:+ start:304 stop:1104 length:801 start_codon:yes stop_codon:yes gene_type:complete
MSAKNKYPMNGKIEYNYNYKPKTSIIINYFTSVDTMIKTINNLRTLGDEIEIIVNNDNHGKDSEKIMNSLKHRNDRMIIANDLGEKRGYHQGAQISIASEFLIFTQDDDLAPNNNQWYLDCLEEFKLDPELGIIGLLKGGFKYGSNDCITFTDQYKKKYVTWLATGPLIIRKDLYFKINGWSEEYSQIGEMDGGADADLTTKVVLSGYKAMLLRNDSVKEWKRRYQRGDGLTKNDLKNIRPRTERILLNDKIYFNKFKDKGVYSIF